MSVRRSQTTDGLYALTVCSDCKCEFARHIGLGPDSDTVRVRSALCEDCFNEMHVEMIDRFLESWESLGLGETVGADALRWYQNMLLQFAVIKTLLNEGKIES